MPHKAYSGSGAEGLINGISGSNTRYGDKEWVGFWGEDIVITIEFDEPTDLGTISTRFHNGQGQWIYAPKSIGISCYDSENKVSTVVKQVVANGLIANISLDMGIEEERKGVT